MHQSAFPGRDLPIARAIGERLSEFIGRLTLLHVMRLAVALIGATTIEPNTTLIAANIKHCSAVEGLSFEAFNP